jgi:hypothetical protein
MFRALRDIGRMSFGARAHVSGYRGRPRGSLNARARHGFLDTERRSTRLLRPRLYISDGNLPSSPRCRSKKPTPLIAAPIRDEALRNVVGWISIGCMARESFPWDFFVNLPPLGTRRISIEHTLSWAYTALQPDTNILVLEGTLKTEIPGSPHSRGRVLRKARIAR